MGRGQVPFLPSSPGALWLSRRGPIDPSPLCPRLLGGAFGGFGFVILAFTLPLQTLQLSSSRRLPLYLPGVDKIQRKGSLGCPRPGLGKSSAFPLRTLRNLFIYLFSIQLRIQPRIRDPRGPAAKSHRISPSSEGPREQESTRGSRDLLRPPPRNLSSRRALLLPVPPRGSCGSCLPALGSFEEKHPHPKRLKPVPRPRFCQI